MANDIINPFVPSVPNMGTEKKSKNCQKKPQALMGFIKAWDMEICVGLERRFDRRVKNGEIKKFDASQLEYQPNISDRHLGETIIFDIVPLQ